MKIYFILVLIFIIAASKDTNDEVRSCIMSSVSNTKKCKTQYSKCFDDVDCNNQYDDLFRNCVIAGGSMIYESECVNSGFIQISNKLLADLFDCLVRQCNVMQGKLQSQKPSTNVSECLSESLLDSSKCWIKNKECQQECQQQLNSLEECQSFIDNNDAANTKKCFQSKEITNSVAKEVKQCMIYHCI